MATVSRLKALWALKLLWLIRAIDWVDDRLFRHKFYALGLCDWIARSSWWGQDTSAWCPAESVLKLKTDAQKAGVKKKRKKAKKTL